MKGRVGLSFTLSSSHILYPKSKERTLAMSLQGGGGALREGSQERWAAISKWVTLFQQHPILIMNVQCSHIQFTTVHSI